MSDSRENATSSHTSSLLSQSSWAVLDQATFAGSNFILNVLLARWLSPSSYGAFAVAFTVFLLIGVFHSAIVIEPMLVLTAGRFRNRLPQYMTAVILAHILFAMVASLALAAAGVGCFWMGTPEIAISLLAFAAASPLILLQWLMRRATYALSRPRSAVLGGIAYLVLMVLLATVLHKTEWLSVATAAGALGLSSLVASCWIMRSFRFLRRDSFQPAILKLVFREHAFYGRWSVGTAVLGFFPPQIPVLLLPVAASLADCGTFKALMNFANPPMQATAAVSLLLLPHFVRSRGVLPRNAGHLLTMVFLGPVVYWSLLGLFHGPLVHWLYAGRFADASHLLWIIGVVPVLTSIINVVGAYLRARDQPQTVFFAYALAMCAAITVGIPAVYYNGVQGAAIALVVSYGINAVTISLCGWQLFRSSAQSTPAKQMV